MVRSCALSSELWPFGSNSVPDLIDKFSAAKVRLAEFTAPDAKLMLVVSAKKVQRITESNPAIYHEGARSVLVFSSKLRLAVRETSEEVRRRSKAQRTLSSWQTLQCGARGDIRQRVGHEVHDGSCTETAGGQTTPNAH